MSNEINRVHEAIADAILKYVVYIPNCEGISHCGILVDEPDEDGDIYVGLIDSRNQDINGFALVLEESTKHRMWANPSESINRGVYFCSNKFFNDNPKICRSDIYLVTKTRYKHDHPFSRMVQDALRLKNL